MPSSTFSPRTILITGANKGIGYEAAKLLAHKLPKTTILLGTRSLDNGANAVQKMKDAESAHSFDNVKPIEIDVTDKSSITKAAEQVKSEYGSLDVLMCNAGVAGSAGETAETVMAVNVDGVHDCIEAFLSVIPASGLITVVTSEVGAWPTHAAPPQLQKILTTPETITWPIIQQLEADWLKANKGEAHEQPWPATDEMATGMYCTSKALINAYLRSWALQHQQPKLVIVCPGYCATDLNHNSGFRTAAKGGESVSWPILNFDKAESGQFYQDGGVQPFVADVPQYAKDGFKKMKEEAEKKGQAEKH